MKDVRFLIVSTGYNCEKYVQECMESISNQTYKNFCVALVDDGSTDKTYIHLLKHLPIGSRVWKNTENYGTYNARDLAIQFGNQHEKFDVIVLLDMDDALLPNALELCAKEYEKEKWMTYGNWRNQNGWGFPLIDLYYSAKTHDEKLYRKEKWRCTHLRTFRKELYFAIPKWELNIGEIRSYPDVEILFSMMEMCGKENIGVISEPIYIYRDSQPLSTLKRFGKDVDNYKLICERPPRNTIKL